MSQIHLTPPIERAPSSASASAGGTFTFGMSRRRHGLCLLILVACSLVPYLNSLRNDFVYDDINQILVNPYVRDFHHLREIFTSSVWSFMGDFRGSSNYYRPVMSLGYLFCYQVFGPHALAFHMANLVANLGVVLLLFAVTLKMFRSAPVAMVAACTFALHPIHSEAVNWIAAITELELAFFYLLTFWIFLAIARPAGRSLVALQFVMAGSFVLALLSKEQSLTLPVIASIYEHFVREDRAETTTIQKFLRYGGLWLLAIIYLLIRARYLGGFAPSLDRPGWAADDLLVSALALFGHYCWKLLWPVELCAYYLLPSDVTAIYPWALGGVGALATCGIAFAVLRKFSRQAAFGVLWFLVTLAPVLNVRWMASNPLAERYLYLPSVGVCWVVGWAGVQAWGCLAALGSRWRYSLVLAGSLIVSLYAARIVARNRDWRDNVTFYRATLAVSPGAYYIHNNLGTIYWGQGNIPAAEQEWRTALRLAPSSEYALHNLGLVANARRLYPEAESLFVRALAIRPNYMDAHLDLGMTYEAMGKLEEAESQFLEAQRLSPLSVRAHNALSEFYMDRGRLQESEAEALRSVEIGPTPRGEWDLGLAEWLQGNRAGAERAFLVAETLAPSDSRAHFMLGLLYMDWGRARDSIREYRAGLQIEPANAEAVANLKKLEILQEQQPRPGEIGEGNR